MCEDKISSLQASRSSKKKGDSATTSQWRATHGLFSPSSEKEKPASAHRAMQTLETITRASNRRSNGSRPQRIAPRSAKAAERRIRGAELSIASDAKVS